MKTTETNKLIAEFMEFKKSIVRNTKGQQYVYWLSEGFELIKEVETTIEGVWCEVLQEQDYCMVEDLKFHSSYDWIMPVVEKIETLNISGKNPEFFIMYDNRPEFHGWYWSIEVPKQFKKDCLGREATKIEAVYNAVHEFILWYNKQKTAN